MKKLSITNIKARVQNLFTRSSAKKEHGTHGADNAWAVLLAISTLIIVGTSIWHLSLFIQVKNDKIFQASVEEESVSQSEVNVKVLEEVISQFDQKKSRFDTFLNEELDIIDPSL